MEAILAITLISVGTVFIMRTYSTSLAAGVISQQYLTASNLVEDLIATTIAKQDISSTESKGKFDPPFEKYEWEISIEEIMPELQSTDELEEMSTEPVSEVEVDNPVYLLYVIKATVSWNYRKDTKELTYQTAVIRKQPEEDLEEFDDAPSYE